jgi:RsiW-degrading membrane proteinase PrsW (M82 family)
VPTPPRFGLGPWWVWAMLWLPVLAAGVAGEHAAGRRVRRAHAGLTVPAGFGRLDRARVAYATTWTGAWLHFVSGAVLATFAALVLELVSGALLLVLVFVPAALLGRVAPRVQELRPPAATADTGENLPLSYWGYLDWWPVQIYLPLLLSVMVPLIEEFSKPVSVLAHLAVRRASVPPALAFRLGALAGAGFALLEGVLNGTAAAGPDWWQVAVLRAAATAMHACGAALVAWGGAEFIWNRRGRLWLGTLAVALLLHAIWNGVTIGLAGVPADGMLLTVAGYACFGGLTALALTGLWLGARRLTRHDGGAAPGAAPQRRLLNVCL